MRIDPAQLEDRVRSDGAEPGAVLHNDRHEATRFVKFVAVGLVNTAFGYAVFSAIYLLLGSYRIAIVVATLAGIIFNFFSTGRIVFRNQRYSLFLPFVLGYVVVCIINIALVDGMAAMAVHPLLAQLLSLPALVLISYAINARFVFGRRR